MPWTTSTKVVRAAGVLEGRVGGLLIVLHPDNGEYAGFDGTAALIWDRLAEPTTFGRLVHTLAAEYQVSPGECAPDIGQWLEGVRRQGLVCMLAE